MKDLAKKFNWWWRDMDKAKATSKALRLSLDSPLYRPETLRAAWMYEAEKRITGKYLAPNKPFPKLTLLQMRNAVYRYSFKASERMTQIVMMLPVDKAADPMDSLNMYWPKVSVNLECSNKAIFRALGPHLDEVRKRKNLNPSKRGPKGGQNPHKDVAWKQIEAWDRAGAGEVLGDNDRKQKSEMAKQFDLRKLRHWMGH